MHEIIGGWQSIGWVVVKALLLYLTAVFGFRLGERRTLAEMSAFDFVAAVAVGGIVGRVPNASTTSYLEGAATLVTVLAAHRVVSRLRQSPKMAALFDHAPSILVSRGVIRDQALRRAGLTIDDLPALLRQQGVLRLADAHLVIFEQRGKLSIVHRSDAQASDSELVSHVDTTGVEQTSRQKSGKA